MSAPPAEERISKKDEVGQGRAALGLLSLVVLAMGAVLCAAEPAAAQYFGRNKVQHDDLDFRVMETENFRIHFTDRQPERVIRDAGRMAERWYERLSRTFQHAFRVKKPLILYADKPDFQQTNAIQGFISQGVGGVTESLKDRVIMPYAESLGETDHVLGHELVHAFQYDIAKGRGGGGTGFTNLPLWAVEGLAEYLSVGRQSPHTAMWMRDAILRDDFPSIDDLAGSEYFPYRYGQAVWAYVGGRFGDETATRFYRVAAQIGLENASSRVLGMPLDTLSSRWESDTRRFYAGTMEGRTDPTELGSLIVPQERPDEGRLYVSPSVSPDGTRVIYLSQEDLFTVDLYLADARTGERLGKVASANAEPHLEALAYMSTSGAWSPEGDYFAFSTYADGDNEIAVADVEDREVVETFDLPDIGAVYSLDWSPDGQRIVFSGARGGITDLYTVDVDDGSVEQLTDDPWTQLHPEYSPDGTTLAFSTDQGAEASMEVLHFIPPGLGLLEVASGRTRLLRPFEDAKHVDPAWSPDGSSLYFISDQDGVSDIYRLALGDESLRRVTRVATGITGVTDLSPALTVAREAGAVLFTVFRDGGYMVRRLAAQENEGGPVGRTLPGARQAGILPPAELQPPVRVEAYLDDPVTGLPDASAFALQDYDAGLGLDYISQPTAGVSMDQFGTQLGGSVAAFFSDMLGNHQLGVGIQAGGGFQDLGGEISYANVGDQLNWGVQAGRMPYRGVRAQRGTGTVDGTQVPTVDLLVERTIINRAGAMAQYPLSINRRFEGSAGVTHIGFDRELHRTFYTPGGTPIAEEQEDLSAPAGLTLFNASTAFVLDRSFMAFTSPVRGARARFEVEQDWGDLQFTNVLADYRRYFFANPVTFAVRGFHYGRYGSDAESQRLTPLFLGFEGFVRGYDAGSFTNDECQLIDDGTNGCPAFDRLIGSRLAMASAEFRIPLNGTEQFGLLDWGVIPVELALFGDAGLAWSSGSTVDLSFEERSSDRIPVFSAGVSSRLNLLGYMVLEIYYAHPFQRPDKDWVWGFQIQPGW